MRAGLPVVCVAGVLALAACSAGTGTKAIAPPPVTATPKASEAPAAWSPSPTPTLPPVFRVRVLELDYGIRARMGTSWSPGCPLGLEDLRVLEMTFWGYDGSVQLGELMVHRRYAAGITGVFRKLFEARFPIERMVIANGYMGNDPPLAQPNNTVGFNCRRSASGSGAWSEHAYGRAVDVNPYQNPYVSPSGRIEPPFGEPWVDRTRNDPGMIRRGDVVVKAFAAIGWRWGGDFKRSKDWMHFSATGN